MFKYFSRKSKRWNVSVFTGLEKIKNGVNNSQTFVVTSHLNITGGEFSHDVSSFVTEGTLVHDDVTNLYRYEA